VKNKITHIIGIDEAGRGPLAGPVSVGVVMVPRGFQWRKIPGVTDSKKLSERERNIIFNRAKELRLAGEVNFSVALIGAMTIDRIGIAQAIRLGIRRCVSRLHANPSTAQVLLDGLLVAPKAYVNQTTIIKGDAKEKVIGLASILAKVTRDAHMVRIAGDFRAYQFEVHKGYGTRFHREAVKKYGLSPIHRKTFCTKLTYPQ
jgi:ribonuclease HII